MLAHQPGVDTSSGHRSLQLKEELVTKAKEAAQAWKPLVQQGLSSFSAVLILGPTKADLIISCVLHLG